MTMRRIVVGASVAAMLAVSIGVSAASAGPEASAQRAVVLRTSLTGAAEAPGPGDPDGSGTAGILLQPRHDRVCWLLRVDGIELPALAAHIHVGAEGVPGPIVVTLGTPDERGRSIGCTTSDVVDAIAANPSDYYVNVHTTSFPGGAVRGQL